MIPRKNDHLSAFPCTARILARSGAIMVRRESKHGHVAFVEAVYPDGSWIASEMWAGFNVVDRRLVRPGGMPLIVFSY